MGPAATCQPGDEDQGCCLPGRGACSCFNPYSLWSWGHVSRTTCLSTSYEERVLGPKECKGEESPSYDNGADFSACARV